MQLDHFFVLTRSSAPEAESLTKLGLVEGTPNDHPGQGTANRRFFFSNTALELLYVRDAREANAGASQGLHLPERASRPDASPFGLIVRRGADAEGAYLSGWRYQPEYFDAGTSFLVAANSERLEEPLCICMPDNAPAGTPQLRSAAPFTEVTELRVHVPVDDPSPTLEAIARVASVSVRTGSDHLLEIVFGHEATGECRDLRPTLPVVLRW